MAKILILGAGISGHTAAAYLSRKLGKKHEIIIVSPNEYYHWIPSNIWVGVGRMTAEQIRFKLQPVYDKWSVTYLRAKAVNFYPEGDTSTEKSFVQVEYVTGEKTGQIENVEYDFLINATGPKLNFEATPGLMQDGNSVSVCSYSHAEEAYERLKEVMQKMEKGQRQKILIGTGHGSATCQGAAFEYILNVEYEIKKRGLREYADIVWISNEFELGDFGMGGAFIKRGGYVTSTKVLTESYFVQRDIDWIKRAAVYKLENKTVYYETLDGEMHEESYDFAMLIPAFSGHGFKAFDKNNNDITGKLFAPNGFMKVDADYSGKPYEEWSVDDWPKTYQNPDYKNIYATGIAFAPPHAISKPMKSKNGRPISPAPPRTGMPSGVIGKVVANNVINAIKTGSDIPKHKASMGKMGAGCIVSSGFGLGVGSAATMTVFPIVPDWEKYPKWGRDIKYTVGESGLAGHWMKLFMHYMFLYKAKGKAFWWILPE
jgi:sulfide:quinone oxidoreductase